MLYSKIVLGAFAVAAMLLGQPSAMAQTGMFPDPALLPKAPPQPAAAAVVRTGKLVYNVTINIKAPMPAGVIPSCGAQVFYWGAGSSTYYEYGYALSDRVGAKATCKITIPYRWDNVAINAPVETRIAVFLSKDDIPTLQVEHTRRLLHRIADIRVPANNTTTTTNFTVDF